MVELLVGLVITGIIFLMLHTIIINGVVISRKSLGRSFIREEVANIVERIADDIRYAVRVGTCQGSMSNEDAICEIYTTERFTWEICDGGEGKYVCKLDPTGREIYRSSQSMVLENFSLDEGTSQQDDFVKRNILITIAGGHAIENLEVHNVVRQSVISTRNYLLD